jgi:putative glycerol-1-phosphate prenyltransferase
MSKTILEFIQKAAIKKEKLLAILLDPDKTSLNKLPEITSSIENLHANFIFVG